MSLISELKNNEIDKLKKEIRKLKREIKILKESIVLEDSAQDQCDRIDEILFGYRKSGESLDEAVARLIKRKK